MKGIVLLWTNVLEEKRTGERTVVHGKSCMYCAVVGVK
jgi:hypothetical protein